MGVMISERVSVGRRYVRAVDLGRDFSDPAALEGYVLTPSARDALGRIVRGLMPSSSQRAFRVTGPYGAGKSSFGVLIARLFANVGDRKALDVAEAAGIAEGDLPDYEPLLLVGRRASISDELLASIAGMSAPDGARPDGDVNERAASLITARREGVRDIAPVLELLAAYGANLADDGSGILLLIDEMGRFIEFAAANPTSEDPAVFQQLAERCGGSTRGLGVVTFLHNRFADYVAGLGEWMEGEWARSAERYEELVFQEPAEQSLFLLADALKPVQKHDAAVAKAASALYEQARSRGVFPTSAAAMKRAAATLYPLHPAVIAALTACSRRMGQNERSTFSFLQSFEPAGLQRFMAETAYGADQWYRLDRLFDYLAAQGDVRFRSPDKERRWHLALDALALATDLADTPVASLKALALISVLEPLAGLASDADTIAWATGVDAEVAAADLDVLLARGLVHRRAGRQDFSLWSSSSVDLEDWLQRARATIPAPRRLDDGIMSALRSRPLAAHRHYQQTGTLRTFSVVAGSDAGADDVDGTITIVPIYPDEDREKRIEEILSQSRERGELHLYNLRHVLPADLALAHELALWTWVRENCPELRIDDLARGEVQRRVLGARSALEALIAPLSRPDDSQSGIWIQGGEIVQIADRRQLSHVLSATCDRIFDRAPILRNELINRSKLSTAISAARTRLLELMISAASAPYLGLEGAPPERTIYLTIFHASQLHRERDGIVGFHGPSEADPMRWRPVWNRIAELLETNGSMRFDDLTDELAKQPYGLRAGPAMLVLTAFFLANRRDIAMMERNTFQPDISVAHFMRLGKNPGNFALRHVGNVEERQLVLEALATRLSVWGVGERPAPALQPIVGGIYSWFNALPDYSKETGSIPSLARDVRSVVKKAREPVELLFDGLPKACAALDPNGAIDVDLYVEKLDLALGAIDDAEPKLRRQVEAATLDAFAVGSINELRDQIRLDYGRHILKIQEYRLRSFVDRAMKTDVDGEGWIDSIASLVAGRRLASWDDQTLDRFTYDIRDLAQRLARWLALARVDAAGTPVLAGVHVTSIDGEEKTVYVKRGAAAPGRAAVIKEVRDLLADRTDAEIILSELFTEFAGRSQKETAS
jgi:hypothetical protein